MIKMERISKTIRYRANEALEERELYLKWGEGFCYVDPHTREPVYEEELAKVMQDRAKSGAKLAKQFRKLRK